MYDLLSNLDTQIISVAIVSLPTCFLRRMSMGGLTVWQSCDLEHTGFSQHSGSSQSVRPSAETINN